MTVAVVGASSSQALWFLSRGSGLVLLVLFSAIVALGVATRIGSAPRWLPRFAVAELHRTLSLFALVLLALHVVTAILDPYVTIGWLATVVPLASHYRSAAIGLGAIALDLLGALVLTSVLRHRIGHRAWRAVHWLAYAAWPIAFAHSLGASTDRHIWWAALCEWGSAALVATAVVTRLLVAGGRNDGAPATGPSRATRTGPERATLVTNHVNLAGARP